MKLTRFSKQPVLAPEPGHDWEDLVVTNPAAFHDEKTGKVYLLYRAAGKDPRYIVHLGLAESSDGFTSPVRPTARFSLRWTVLSTAAAWKTRGW